MPNLIESAEGNTLPTLSPKLVQTLLAMIRYPTDQEAIANCPYSERQFYRYKPLLDKYKLHYLNASVRDAQDMLKSATKDSASELIKELKDRDVKARNKAANDILDRTLPKKPDVAVQVNNYQVSQDQLDRLL